MAPHNDIQIKFLSLSTVALDSQADKAKDNHPTIGKVDGEVEQMLRTSDESSAQLETSRLLLLPKELRLEIWQYVLPDSADTMLVLRITRNLSEFQPSGKRFLNSLYKYPDSPEIDAFFDEPPSSPIGGALLRTNHLIYAEALPLLYRSVTFYILDLEGIFALFLDTLSDFAKANIRYIRLCTQTALRSKHACFYWALTCAQLAKLNHTQSLHQVQVLGLPAGDKEFNKRVIYAPLMKIKAPLVCLSDHDAEFQQVLAETAAQQEAKAEIRKKATEADNAERRRLANLTRYDVDYPPKKRLKVQDLQDLVLRGRPEIPIYSPIISNSEVAHDLAETPGFEAFQKNFPDWELVVDGGKRLRLPNFYATRRVNEDAWSEISTPRSAFFDIEAVVTSDDEDLDEWDVVGGTPS